MMVFEIKTTKSDYPFMVIANGFFQPCQHRPPIFSEKNN